MQGGLDPSTSPGRFRARVRVGETVPAGTCATFGLWWSRYTEDGANCNATTSTAITDFGGGATFFDNLVQVAHNVVIGRHCVVVAQVGISGSSRLGNYVTLAGQVGLAGHLEIGDRAVLGAQSGVNKSLAGGRTYMGYPAVPAEEWREEVALTHRLGKLFARVKQLEQQVREQLPRSTPETSSSGS